VLVQSLACPQLDTARRIEHHQISIVSGLDPTLAGKPEDLGRAAAACSNPLE
jgi:hypothetical protein